MATVSQVDQATFQRLLANDPDVQAVIRRVWGDTPINQRPGNTPKNLEKANDAASKEINRILKAKGVQLPPHTFINPRTSAIEAEHGWAGLPTAAKIAIIAGAATGGIGLAGALGAFGGAAAAGAGGASAGGAGAGIGAGTAGTLASTSLAGSAALPIAAGTSAATSGALAGAGLGGAAAGGATAAGGGGILSTLGKLAASKGVSNAGNVLGKQQEGAAHGRIAEGQLGQSYDRNAIDLYGAQQGAQNQAAQLDLQRKDYDAKSRSAAGKQALLAMLMSDYRPSQVSVPGVTNAQLSGGMGETIKNNPAILSLLKSIADKGVTDQATPNTYTGGTVVPPPTLTPLPQEGKSGKILDTISRISQIYGAVGGGR